MLIGVIELPEHIVCDVGVTTGALGGGNNKVDDCLEVERIF